MYICQARYGKVYLAEKAPKRQRTNDDSLEISFGEADLEGVMYSHDDALVVFLEIANCMIKQVLVDNKSSTNILV